MKRVRPKIVDRRLIRLPTLGRGFLPTPALVRTVHTPADVVGADETANRYPNAH
jgi:hypothetical protein